MIPITSDLATLLKPKATFTGLGGTIPYDGTRAGYARLMLQEAQKRANMTAPTNDLPALDMGQPGDVAGGLYGGLSTAVRLLGARPGDTHPVYPSAAIDNLLDQSGQFNQQAAEILARLPYDQQAAHERANAAGIAAQLKAIPGIDPNAPAYSWQDLPNAPMPVRVQPTIPTRPAPGFDPMAGILAAIAGLVDPKAAGQFNTAPLQAGLAVADQRYNDAQTKFAEATQQAAMQYADQVAERRAQLENALYNRSGATSANERLLGAKRADDLMRAGLTGSGVLADTLGNELGTIGADASKAGGLQAKAGNAVQRINALEREHDRLSREWQATNSVAAKQQIAAQQAAIRLTIAQLKTQELQQAALLHYGTGGASDRAHGIGPDGRPLPEAFDPIAAMKAVAELANAGWDASGMFPGLKLNRLPGAGPLGGAGGKISPLMQARIDTLQTEVGQLLKSSQDRYREWQEELTRRPDQKGNNGSNPELVKQLEANFRTADRLYRDRKKALDDLLNPPVPQTPAHTSSTPPTNTGQKAKPNKGVTFGMPAQDNTVYSEPGASVLKNP